MKRPFIAVILLVASVAAAHAFGLGRLGAGFGKLGALGGAGSAPSPPSFATRPVATGALVAQSFVTGLATGTVQGQSRYSYFTGAAPVSQISLCYGNWAGPGEAVSSSPANITIDAGIELNAPAMTQPVLWSGQPTVTIAPGGLVCSDPLLASAFSTAAFPYVAFPASGQFFVRTNIVTTNLSQFPFSYTPPTGAQAFAGPAFTSQSTGTGPMTTPAGGAAANAMTTPFAILGKFTVPNMPGYCIIGDSIDAGIGDTNPEFTGNGYFNRFAYGTDGNYLFPTMNLAIEGEGAAVGAYPTRSTLFQNCTTMVSGYGTNNLAGGSSVSTLMTALHSLYAQFRAAGVSTVLQKLIVPRTTSTDGWATTTNQTPIANFGVGANRDIANTAMQADVGTQTNGVLNFNPAVQDQTNTAVWLTNGTANFTTIDGIHPSPGGAALMAPVATTAITGVGLQLPARDLSWVVAGASFDFDFQNGRYFGLNPASTSFANGSGLGETRTSVAWGDNIAGTNILKFAAQTPRIYPGRGLFEEKSTTNLFANPFAPATQTATVVNATQYTVSIVGSGSLTLSGAGTGTVTFGNPVTFTSSTTSLTATVSGSPLAIQIETGAVATTPTTGTRAVDATNIANGLLTTAQATAATIVVSTETGPLENSTDIIGGGAIQLLNRGASTTQINTFNGTNSIVSNFGSGGFTTGPNRYGVAYDGTGRGISANGSVITSDANTRGTLTNLWLGGTGSTTHMMDGVIQRLTVWPTRLTAATTPTLPAATSNGTPPPTCSNKLDFTQVCNSQYLF
jgi:hypothetical protein